MAKKLGKDCKFYYGDDLLDGSAKTPETVAWNEVENVRDLSTNLDTDEANVTTRGGNNGFKSTLTTYTDGGIEFEMMWDPDDPAITVFQEAWANRSQVALAAMDGEIGTSGSQGLVGNFSVPKFNRSEPLTEGVKVSITVKPYSQTQWYKAA